jgi:hypothetical protein
MEANIQYTEKHGGSKIKYRNNSKLYLMVVSLQLEIIHQAALPFIMKVMACMVSVETQLWVVTSRQQAD